MSITQNSACREWTCQTFSDIVKKAREMDILPSAALRMRARYLRDRVNYFMNEHPDAVTITWILQDIADVLALERKSREEKINEQHQKDGITPEMIERARSTPIETIVEFIRGKARCLSPKHDDKNPSMFHGTRTNTAVCPVCGEKFDAIAAYQRIWGTDFPTTIRRLQ